jgi:methylated-DNA-protein-cysteine methyltransferase-like protein
VAEKKSNKFDQIREIASGIPYGHVMSYGQLGQMCGVSGQMAGWAMATVPMDVPWHRVVGAKGDLPTSRRSEELGRRQRELLEAEGVEFLENGLIDMKRFQI